jgi:sRNA-binding regulator protein Hfq
LIGKIKEMSEFVFDKDDYLVIAELEKKLELAKKHAITKEDERRKTLEAFESFVRLPDALEAEKQKLVYKPNEVTMHVIRFGNQIQR